MKAIFVPLAATLWLLGAGSIAWFGWNPDLPTWRLITAGISAAVVVSGITAALARRRPEPNVVALVATTVLAATLPAPVAGPLALAKVVLAGAAILAGYYTLQLSLRMHAVAGPMLKHGMMRIAGTIAVATLAAGILIAGLRAALGATSVRMAASLDQDSGLMLGSSSILLMAIITALSMLMVARTHEHLDEVNPDEDS